MMATVTEAASKPESEVYALTYRGANDRVPYSELARRSNLLAELRKRVSDIREQPSILMTLPGTFVFEGSERLPCQATRRNERPPSGSAQNGGDQAARPAPPPSGGEVSTLATSAAKASSIGCETHQTVTIKIRTVAKFAAQLKPSWAADHAADHTAAETAADCDAANTAAAAGEVVAGDTSDALPMLA